MANEGAAWGSVAYALIDDERAPAARSARRGRWSKFSITSANRRPSTPALYSPSAIVAGSGPGNNTSTARNAQTAGGMARAMRRKNRPTNAAVRRIRVASVMRAVTNARGAASTSETMIEPIEIATVCRAAGHSTRRWSADKSGGRNVFRTKPNSLRVRSLHRVGMEIPSFSHDTDATTAIVASANAGLLINRAVRPGFVRPDLRTIEDTESAAAERPISGHMNVHISR